MKITYYLVSVMPYNLVEICQFGGMYGLSPVVKVEAVHFSKTLENTANYLASYPR
jgi:hypothetical protein